MKMFKQETQFCILLNPLFPGRKGEGLKFTDEPTGNLDEDTAMSIMQILEESVRRMKKCAVIVTHSHEIAKRADVVFHLKRGALQIKKK